MMTVDCHLHLTESAAQAPIWWMEEMYRPYGGEYIWTDGEAIVGVTVENGQKTTVSEGD